MSNKLVAVQDARQLMQTELRGVLSTQSVTMPGYPFGSQLPFCLDENSWPVVQVARISQHTRNMNIDSKVSLIICEPGHDDVLTGKRLTIVGDAEKIEDRSFIADHYYRFFPQGRDYQKAHDSDFYRIKPVRSRYIGGFAQAFWFDNDLLFKANPFFAEAGIGAIDHMNEDHSAALDTYCRNANIHLKDNQRPVMIGIDAEGIHLLAGRSIVRITFAQPVMDFGQLRRQLVAMAGSTEEYPVQ